MPAPLNSEIRNIVRTKEGKKVWQDGERKEIEFFEKALVVTDIGSQERDDNKQLKYVITLPAILRFLENNRRWFKEVPAPGGFIDIEFDNTDKTKPFKLEEQLKVEMEDNIKIVDYVSMIDRKCGMRRVDSFSSLTTIRILVFFFRQYTG